MRTAAMVVVMLMVGCGGSIPEEVGGGHPCEAVDAGAGLDAGPTLADCDSDAGMSACLEASLRLNGCCATASIHGADDPAGYCHELGRLVLDPVQHCEDIAAADCDTLRSSGLCH